MDPYLRQRLDSLSQDSAIAGEKLDQIERHLLDFHTETKKQEERLDRLERRLYALWLIGPFVVGGGVFLNALKSWTER